MSETDKEICITAELPDIEQKDINVSVSGNQTTITGEKVSDRGKEGR